MPEAGKQWRPPRAAAWQPFDLKFPPLPVEPDVRSQRGVEAAIGSRAPSATRISSRAAVVLIVLSATSYITTFVRERYFYQHALGSPVLDHAEVVMSLIAVLSNTVGTMLVFGAAAGKLRPWRVPFLSGFGIVLAALIGIVSLPIGLMIGIGLAQTGYLLFTQQAAGRARQAPALVAAVTAAAPTLAVWMLLGTGTLERVFLGYFVGAIWQALGAFFARGVHPVRVEASSGGSLWWPVLYLAAIQVDALIDQTVLLTAGTGWAGAAALGYSLFAASVTVIMAPLANEALSGRLDLSRRLPAALLSTACGALFVGLAPVAMKAGLVGGHVNGAYYSRLLHLTLIYGCAIPFSIYWQLYTRAAHRQSSQWRQLALLALVVFVAHGAALVPVVLIREWTLVPVGTVAGFGFGCVAWQIASRRPMETVEE